ncbi:hypothetical protein L2E82_48228 [Cichorium intybus]|uniref:Uncharacterized protein n=1 Tax=Cichorium intybus TaxID=13427 RepID=A0ACB8YZ63_CICIN|nr:hypothetical protein L2E82_48228 [Cichorium intybus]
MITRLTRLVLPTRFFRTMSADSNISKIPEGTEHITVKELAKRGKNEHDKAVNQFVIENDVGFMIGIWLESPCFGFSAMPPVPANNANMWCHGVGDLLTDLKLIDLQMCIADSSYVE